MLVYRIEHSVSRIGPYHCALPHDYPNRNMAVAVSNLTDALQAAHSTLAAVTTHPTMYADVLVRTDEDLYCGFTSIAQLLEWFDGFMADLHSAGYIVCVYESEHVFHGSRQVAFDRARSSLVRTIKIPALNIETGT